ncbi:MAG: tRNA (cytidine(34)-2'-O)-methyltransferase [Chloroflexota bacterium]|nr:tRNA (cytidine(34)-2'-O)-methyltransferase [SAR202 cluster bacterium]GIT16021.1 MAG: tRNA (cytidine(34)-2'-O)-methyltransferase [Chloroflexota bacterium]|tara:strand:+ start:4319 stop:4792 length:474 start_codon:yes stop_codon:yes gene_type:complete
MQKSSLLNIVLYEPEIPVNAGNIIRLCANTGCSLHMIKPLGFDLDDKGLRRAGLDYRDLVDVTVYSNFEEYLSLKKHNNMFITSTLGKNLYSDIQYNKEDAIVFGPESTGLPEEVFNNFNESSIRLPMVPANRSLNISNTVAVVIYEAWRQMGFVGI